MANFLFDAFRNNSLQSAAPDLLSVTLKAMFVDHADDTPAVTDDFLDDIASAARVPAVGSAPTIGTKTVGSVGVGIFDAADTVFTTLTGDQSESLIILEDSGVEGTSDLVARWDTATGLPLTPNGANVTVTWAAGGIITF